MLRFKFLMTSLLAFPFISKIKKNTSRLFLVRVLFISIVCGILFYKTEFSAIIYLMSSASDLLYHLRSKLLIAFFSFPDVFFYISQGVSIIFIITTRCAMLCRLQEILECNVLIDMP